MSARAQGRSSDADQTVTALPELLVSEFEHLGLSPYEARVMVAMLKLGSATTAQLEAVANLPRTSTYKVLQSLAVKRLAERLPVEGAAVWAPAPRDEVLDRLYEAEQDTQEQRLRQLQARTDHARALLAQAFPAVADVPPPFVHLLHGAAQMKRVYEQIVTEARTELAMFTRPPYAWQFPSPNRAVLDMLLRGVKARVLYQAEQWHDPGAEAFRTEMEIYHRAGVEARLAERLPIKLIVVDRRVTLVNMAIPDAPDGGYPTTLHIEHEGYAEIQADAFERRWETAVPLMPAAPAEETVSEGLGSDATIERLDRVRERTTRA